MVRGKWLAGLLVVAVAAVATVTLADAEKGPLAKAHRGWVAHTPLGQFLTGQVGRLMVLRSELDVTDQQKAEIKKVLVSHKSEIIVQVKSLWQKRQSLRDAVLAEKTDEAAIRRAADNLGKAIGDAAVLAAKLKGEVAPVLTSEQKQRIKEFRMDADQATEKFLGKLGQNKAVKSTSK